MVLARCFSTGIKKEKIQVSGLRHQHFLNLLKWFWCYVDVGILHLPELPDFPQTTILEQGLACNWQQWIILKCTFVGLNCFKVASLGRVCGLLLPFGKLQSLGWEGPGLHWMWKWVIDWFGQKENTTHWFNYVTQTNRQFQSWAADPAKGLKARGSNSLTFLW